MKLKKLAALVLCLLLALSAASCGGTAPTPTVPPSPTDAPTPTEIPFDLTPESKKITVWINDSKPDNVIVQSFLQTYPEYEVDFSVSATNPFGSLDKTLDLPRLAAAIASGTQPDLFLGGGRRLAQIGVGAHRVVHLPAAHARHHHIKHHQVGLNLANEAQPFKAIFRRMQIQRRVPQHNAQ